MGRAARIALGRLGFRAAYRVAVVWWAVRRPSGRGVKVVALREDGRVLLVRHTYGPRRWTFPGGGAHRREPPQDAARRELREEVGIVAGDLEPLGAFPGHANRRTDDVHAFLCRVGMPAVEPRAIEIAEAAWVLPEELPRPLDRYATRTAELFRASAGAGPATGGAPPPAAATDG